MKAQFKYALRYGWDLRLTTFVIVVAVNLLFMLLGLTGAANSTVMTWGVVLSSLGITAIISTNIIADVLSYQGIFGAPHGYLGAMTPVSSRKVLSARVITSTLEDFLALGVAIAGTTVNSMIMEGQPPGAFTFSSNAGYLRSELFMVLIALLGYAYIKLLVVFGLTLKSTLFFSLRGRGFLAMLAVFAAAWALSLLDFALIPLGELHVVKGLIFSVAINIRSAPTMAVYLVITLIRLAVLFFASTSLLERRINL